MTAVFICTKSILRMPEIRQIVFLQLIGDSQNLEWFWVISTPKSLTALKGIYIRVNPSFLQEGWWWLVAWRQRVVKLALIDPSLKALFVTLCSNSPANRGAVIPCRRLYGAATWYGQRKKYEQSSKLKGSKYIHKLKSTRFRNCKKEKATRRWLFMKQIRLIKQLCGF